MAHMMGQTKLLIMIAVVISVAGCTMQRPPEGDLGAASAPVRFYPDLPMIETPEVQSFLKFYTNEGRRFVVEAHKRKATYGKKVKVLLARHGIRETFSNVAVIESGFRPEAKSPAGAAGLWQFMPDTAEHYNLEVGFIDDDRFDIEHSTNAAARYMIDLYKRFNDWHLALAAYNSGPMRIQKAININGGNTNFFSLARSGALSKETAEFVAKVIAISIIYKNPTRYGFAFRGQGNVPVASDEPNISS